MLYRVKKMHVIKEIYFTIIQYDSYQNCTTAVVEVGKTQECFFFTFAAWRVIGSACTFSLSSSRSTNKSLAPVNNAAFWELLYLYTSSAWTYYIFFELCTLREERKFALLLQNDWLQTRWKWPRHRSPTAEVNSQQSGRRARAEPLSRLNISKEKKHAPVLLLFTLKRGHNRVLQEWQQ